MKAFLTMTLIASASLLTSACSAEPQPSSGAENVAPADEDNSSSNMDETAAANSPQPANPGVAASETKIASSDAATPAKAGTAASPSGAWTVDYAKSTLGFSATETGTAFDGRFEKYDAKINFNPADLSSAFIDVTVDMTSAKTGDKQRDIALPEDDWFAAKKFPSTHFTSTKIEKTGVGEYIAHGLLTIREASKPVNLPFSLRIDGDTAHAIGSTSLARTDYGVGQGDFADDQWVGLNVKVTVDIVATR